MKTTYEAVIGLEVHCQLATRSKIFCACPVGGSTQMNQAICPVCTGHPGTLPRLNKKAVEFAIQAGLATHCRIASKSLFARKSYFYPDLPKGYQISQYSLPLCEDGFLEIHTPKTGYKKIGIERIHLEEDAGKNHHFETCSIVDLNRAGVPLIEVVSRPDMKTAEEAGAYLRALYAVITYLGICIGDLQEGHFRCDVNLSVMPTGSREWGTRTEIKNVNSFRFVEKAIDSEMKRQIVLLERGEKVHQETRTFDPVRQETLFLRSKGQASDYRYFPEPDLLPLSVSPRWIASLEEALPELPHQKKVRYERDWGLSSEEATVLLASKSLSGFFEQAMALLLETSLWQQKKAGVLTLVHLLTGELSRLLNETGQDLASHGISPVSFVQVIELVDNGLISYGAAKQVVVHLWNHPQDSVAMYVDQAGLKQVNDMTDLDQWADEVLAQNPREVAAYRNGKKQLLGFFVGQAMKKSQGKANPSLLSACLERKLNHL